MSEHNFEIGDVVTMKAPLKAVYEGTVTQIYKQGIEVHFLCGDRVYISNYMLYTLTNITKQQKATQDNQSTTSEQESKEQQMKEQNIKQSNIKPEDEVTITVTYRDLAKMYALFGRTGCKYGNHQLYYKLKRMLDPSGTIRGNVLLDIRQDLTLQYELYQEKFESLLFPEPIETEQQKQIRELREQAEALLQKAKDIESSQK